MRPSPARVAAGLLCFVALACGGSASTVPDGTDASTPEPRDAATTPPPDVEAPDAGGETGPAPRPDAGDSGGVDASTDAGPSVLARVQAFYAVSKILQAPNPPLGAPTVDRAFVYGANNYATDIYAPASAVDGVLLRFGWDSLEPAAGTYDFRQVLYEAKKAVTAGKKVQLSVISGTMAPEWLCPAVDGATPHASCMAGPPDAAHPYCFRTYDGARDGANCRCRITPVPWAPQVRDPFRAMLVALKAALLDVSNGGLTPAQLGQITLVRASGINYQTEELKLSNGAASCGTDVEIPAAWAAAPVSYTADKLIATWDDNASFILSTFPGAATSAATTADSFPTDPARPATGAYIVGKLQAAMVGKFAGRHLLQVNALSPTFEPADLFAARDAGVPIAFQTNTWLGNDLGAKCGRGVADPTLCVDKGDGAPSYFDLLSHGLCKGANYIEVFAADVGRYPKALTAARALPFGTVTCR